VRVFQPAHHLFSEEATRVRFIGNRNQSYVDALRSLQQAMDRLARSSGSEEANGDAAKAYRGGLEIVKSISYNFDVTDVAKEARRFLEEPIRKAGKLFTEDFVKAEGDRLQSGLNKLCREATALRKKRPFNPKAEEEATEADLVRFFAFREGELWKFKQAYLQQLILKQNGRWEQSSDGARVNLGSQFLDYFNHLASISDALFPPDGTKPRMEYTIRIAKPANVTALSLDAGLGEVQAGQHTLTWPAYRFRIKVTPGSPMADFEGLWSLFSMASRANHKSNGVLELNCVFSLGAENRCNTNSGTDGKEVVVQIHTIKPPNGVERSLDKGFLEVSGTCPVIKASRR
jgi:type VI protein secretion system component VasK